MTASLLQQAERSLRQGDAAGARDLALKSDRAEALLFLAMLESGQNRPQQALEQLYRYLELRPADANAWYNVGMLQAQQAQGSAAREAYEKALAVDARHLPSLVGMAQLLAGQGNGTRALSLLKQAWTLEEGHPVVADALSRVLPGEQALPVLQRALERHPGHRATRVRLAQVRHDLGQPHAALTDWQQAAQAGADPVQCLVGQTRALVDLGRGEAAIEPLNSALAANPDPALRDALAVALNAAGRHEAAVQSARAAVAAAPGNARYRFNLASLLSLSTDQAQLEESVGLCQQLLTEHGEDAPTQHCLAMVYNKLERPAEALVHAGKAVAMAGTPRHFLTLADCQIRLDAKAALETLETAIERHGDDARLLRQRGIARLKIGQAALALEDLDHSLQLDPADQRSIAHRAMALVGLGRSDEAEDYSGLRRWVFERRPQTPPGFEGMPAFNRQMAEDIRNHSLMRWEPLGLAARNGGLTDDLTADQTPAIRAFELMLRDAIDGLCTSLKAVANDPFLQKIPLPGQYTLNIWATLVREGGLIDTHIHEDSWLSGAYYVALPDSAAEAGEQSGAIEFGRPHADLPQADKAPVRVIVPETGLLLMFPSFLFHRTLPFRSPQDRISISFDATPT